MVWGPTCQPVWAAKFCSWIHQHVGRSIRFNSGTSQFCRVKQLKILLSWHCILTTSSPEWYQCESTRALILDTLLSKDHVVSFYIFLVQVNQIFVPKFTSWPTYHLSSPWVTIGEAIKVAPASYSTCAISAWVTLPSDSWTSKASRWISEAEKSEGPEKNWQKICWCD